MKYPALTNVIGGQPAPANGALLDVFSPRNGEKISTVPLSSAGEVEAAVAAGQQAFPAWAELPIKERVQVFFRYRTLLEKQADDLANLGQHGVDQFRIGFIRGVLGLDQELKELDTLILVQIDAKFPLGHATRRCFSNFHVFALL